MVQKKAVDVIKQAGTETVVLEDKEDLMISCNCYQDRLKI